MLDVSVVTRTYDSAATIERALDSLDEQTLDNRRFECVVIDDGSTDGTAAIVEAYAAASDLRIRFVETEHSGPVSTLNEGIERSRNECVVVLDADDYFLPEFLERTLDRLAADPDLDFVYTDYYEDDPSGERAHVDTGENLVSTITIGVLFRKNALDAVGRYDESMTFSEYDLLVRLDRNGSTGTHVPEALFVYDRREDSLTGDRELIERGKRELRERYGEDFAVREY